MDEYLSIPGYLPAREAARRIGCCTERLLQYAREGRLPFRLIQGRYLIPIAALTAFQRKPHGRLRTRPVPWRTYRTAVVRIRQIEAPILAGLMEKLSERLATIAEQQEHCFPGTMSRIVSVDDKTLSVLLVWKSTELDEAALERDVDEFKAALVDLVDWSRVRDVVSGAIAHT